MNTLFSLCIDFIINNNVPYFEKIPELLEEQIKETELRQLCGYKVNEIKQIEETRELDYFVGYIDDGIREVLQKKYYVYSNARLYEKNRRKGIDNCGHLKCSLILYY